MIRTRLAPLVAAALVLTGCGDDIIAVKGKIADTAPQVGAFHTVYAIHAYDIASLGSISTTPNGDFSMTYSGSRFSGNVNKQTGFFQVKLELFGSFLYEVDDSGLIEVDGSGNVTSARYAEHRLYADSTSADWDTHFLAGSTTLEVHATERGRGTRVHGIGAQTANHLRIDETWSLSSIFEEQVTTIYNYSGSVSQNWTRDDIATAVRPDRSANFSLAADNSGSGELDWNYDHGITQKYVITLAADGSYTSTLTFEDPGTTVSPDGQGTFSVNAQYVGSGDYVERYDDGSELDLTETYSIDGSTRDDFSFDDASTLFTPDLDGRNTYQYDGSGDGFWNVHDTTGVVQTCTYDFDATGTLENLACTGSAAFSAASAAAPSPARHFARVVPFAP